MFEKQCNGLAPLEKDACVSFVKEDGEKGPIAKDIRLEDPVRVARVTAKIRYGRVEVQGTFAIGRTWMLTSYRVTSTLQKRSRRVAMALLDHSKKLATALPRSMF